MPPPGEMGTPARTSMRQSLQQDEDEYDLEALAGISDGFRFNPTQQQTLVPEVSQVELPPQRRQSIIQSQFNNTNPPPRPSSISKPKFAADNFALRHDGTMGPLSSTNPGSPSSAPATHSNPISLLSRASSVSTVSTQSTALMHSEGPYQGPSGPSFPYQMYPQNAGVARTMSVATTSTAAIPERPYEGPAGPTHPYGMYPQSITPDAHEALPVAPIPAGFPGLNNDYQRRIGPEGEEAADLIGPDGHTEQLPPYTQYPEDAVARKMRGVAVPALAVGAVEVGAGGLGLATRNPEFDSPREEAASPLAGADRASVLSRGSSNGSSQQTVINAADSPSEKPPLKHWQIVAKRKVCGIVPIWVFVLMAVTILIMVAILAGVLTALKPKKRHNNNPGSWPNPLPQSDTNGQTTVYSTVTTTFDAHATTVPTSFPVLPTGSFGLMLGSPDDTQTDCIQNSAQLNAWSCAVPPIPISIDVTTNETTKHNTAILSSPQNLFAWNYGTQPPIVNAQRKLDLVIDIDNPSYGPAWFFQVPYDKLVVLHENQLTVPSSSSGKREASWNPSSPGLSRKSPAQPGDQPWFCYWNGTLLETFIFANETSAAGAQEASSASGSYASATTSRAYNGAYAAPSTSSSASSTPTTRSEKKRQVVSGSYQPPPSGVPTFEAGYPKIVKIEERRIPEGGLTVAPYCISMTIASDGTPIPNKNSSGDIIQIALNETDPSLSQMSQKRGYVDLATNGIIRRSEIPGDCSCVWMAT